VIHIVCSQRKLVCQRAALPNSRKRKKKYKITDSLRHFRVSIGPYSKLLDRIRKKSTVFSAQL